MESPSPTTNGAQASPMASTSPIVVPRHTDPTDSATSSPAVITTAHGLAPPSVSPLATTHSSTPNGSASAANAMMPPGATKGRGVPKSQTGMNGGRWTEQEHQSFLAGLRLYGREWKKVASKIKTRTSAQIRSHAQKYFAKLARDDETRKLGNGLPLLALGPDGASSLYGGYMSDDESSTTAGNLSGDEDTDAGLNQPPPATIATTTPSHRTILPVHPFPSPVLAPPTPGLSISSLFSQRGSQSVALPSSTTKKRARPSRSMSELSPPSMGALASHSHPFKQLKPAANDAALFHRLPSPEELIETVSPPVRQRLSSLIEAEISALQVLSCYTWLQQQQQGDLKVQLQPPSRHGPGPSQSSGPAVFPTSSLTMFAAERSPSIF